MGSRGKAFGQNNPDDQFSFDFIHASTKFSGSFFAVLISFA
jgi:hypothetical protein